jgi:hypothetical protein
MSVVHDALRKAERERQRRAGISELDAAAPAAPARPTQTEPPSQAADQSVPPAAAVLAPVVPATGRSRRVFLAMLLGCVAMVAAIASAYLVIRGPALLRELRPDGETPAVNAAPAAAGLTVATEPPPAIEAAEIASPSSPAPEPVAAPAPQPVSYQLTGIMRDADGNFCAIVNGRVVYAGGSVEGATVKSIETDRVNLDVDGRETVLRLY